MERNNSIMIPIFDGKEYANWKIRLLKYLQFKKCQEVITRKILSTDDKDKWMEKDVQATNYIYGAITNKQLEYISECETAYDIITKFDTMYLKGTTSLQIVYRNNLENLKLKNYSEIDSFFDEFEKSVNELKQAGATISENEKLNYMLRALPSEYSHIGDLLDVLPKEERTVDYLKNKIKIKYLAQKPQEKSAVPDKSNAFKAETKAAPNSNLCFVCGKPGHVKKNCWYNKGQNVNNNNYRGRGHYIHRTRGRGFNRGREFSRGRGRNDSASNTQSEQNNFHTSVIQSNMTSSVYENKPNKNQITWLLDSGCTDHIINKDEYFEKSVILKNPVKVKVGDGRMLEATKVGDIKLYFPVYGSRTYVTVRNVFYVKEMKANLLSYARITDKNNTVVSKGHWAKIYDSNGKVMAIAQKEESLYRLISYVEKSEIQANTSKSVLTVKEKLHRTLGHVNFKYLDIMCKDQLLEGIPKEIESEYMKCAICIENKMHNLPFKNNRRRAEDILEIVHTDVNGPHNTTGYGGEKYFVTFIDDYSKLAKVYCIKSKDQVADCFIEYVNAVQNLTGKMIKELRCDNGKEYMNSKMYSFAREKGIIIKACPAYVHELNGTAERYNRTIMDMARCLLAEARVNRCYWPEVIKTAAYLKNRSLANTIVKKTPYEIFFNKKPSIK
uniref:Endonuclease n=1 Tax=Heliothis virescens TaxID=7102 RepID=A0A2A4K3T3_HELVI